MGPRRDNDLSADLDDEYRDWFERVYADRLRRFEEELGWLTQPVGNPACVRPAARRRSVSISCLNRRPSSTAAS